jgi:hypothetical protein
LPKILSPWRFSNPPKSPFFKGGLFLQFLVVAPIIKGELGGFVDIKDRKNILASCKIHLRLVAQAFQPVQMRVAGRCNSNDPQFSNILFMKEYQDDISQI